MKKIYYLDGGGDNLELQKSFEKFIENSSLFSRSLIVVCNSNRILSVSNFYNFKVDLSDLNLDSEIVNCAKYLYNSNMEYEIHNKEQIKKVTSSVPRTNNFKGQMVAPIVYKSEFFGCAIFLTPEKIYEARFHSNYIKTLCHFISEYYIK